jgi:hypothetical protein
MSQEIQNAGGMDPQPAAAIPEFQVEEISQSKRKWVMTLHPNHLGLRAIDETQPYIFFREDFFQKLEFMASMRILTLRQAPKKGFKLDRQAVGEFQKWFGRPSEQQLALLLKRHYGISLPVALILILAAFVTPVGSGAPAGSLAFAPIQFGLGLWLLVTWVLSRIKPTPALFLCDALWFLVVTGGQLLRISRTHHWWLIFFTAWLVFMAVLAWKRYRLFRPLP